MASESTRLLAPAWYAPGGGHGGVLGVACIALSTPCMALSAAMTKWVEVNPLFYIFVLHSLTWSLSITGVLVAWHFLSSSQTLFERLVGWPGVRGLLFLRALVYYTFKVMWVFVILSMPIGVSTCIAFSLGPLMTGIYAWIFLGEPMYLWLLPIGVASIVGATLVIQPTAIFGHGAAEVHHNDTYFIGASLAIACTALIALLPIFNRKLAECHWTTVQHVSDLLGVTVLTPVALTVFAYVDAAKFSASWHALACVLRDMTHQCEPSPIDGGPRPRPYARLALLCNVLLLFSGLALQTHGYQIATHALRAKMAVYLEIPISFMLQQFVFGDPLNAYTLLGACIIVAASIMNVLLKPPQPESAEAKTKDGPSP